ncbi:MAG: hypothetical protein KGJ68_03840 [Gammaproteobacteria bacterium]|nr:hypothetical protein [Gammaproteobacteria bacterium]
MRIVVGLLACLSATALSAAFADPPAASSPTAASPAAAPASTASTPAAAKPADEADVRHLLAEGYKPEMHHGEEVYCRKDGVLGSRLSTVKTCGTVKELKLLEDEAKRSVQDTQRVNSSSPH